MRICDLLLGPPPSQARLADHLDEAIRQLGVELEALQTLVARVWDLVLHNTDGPSSLATSLSMTQELLKGHVSATTTNGICWGIQSALVTALLHFSELELLGSGCNTDLTEDQVDAF
jgi:hypothetical protein